MRFPRRATAPLPQPYSFECGGCGEVHHSLDTGIPVGWSILRKSILCPTCTASAIHRAGRIRSARS